MHTFPKSFIKSLKNGTEKNLARQWLSISQNSMITFKFYGQTPFLSTFITLHLGSYSDRKQTFWPRRRLLRPVYLLVWTQLQRFHLSASWALTWKPQIKTFLTHVLFQNKIRTPPMMFLSRKNLETWLDFQMANSCKIILFIQTWFYTKLDDTIWNVMGYVVTVWNLWFVHLEVWIGSSYSGRVMKKKFLNSICEMFKKSRNPSPSEHAERGGRFCFVLFCFALLCFALLCFALLCFALLCFAFVLFWFLLGRKALTYSLTNEKLYLSLKQLKCTLIR